MNKYNLYIFRYGRKTVFPLWSDHVNPNTVSRLYFIHKGSFFIRSEEGKLFQLKEGNCYLVPIGFSYSYGCNGEMSHSYFHISLSTFDRIDILSEVKKPISCKFEKFPTTPLSFDSPNESLCMETYLSGILYKLLKEHNISLKTRVYSKEVGLAIEYIKNNLSAQIGTDEVALNAFSAKSTITRAFRREVGMSIGEYIDALIFAKATELLNTEGISVGEVSELLGFGDRFYFSRRFTQKFKCSPNEYRKKNLDL